MTKVNEICGDRCDSVFNERKIKKENRNNRKTLQNCFYNLLVYKVPGKYSQNCTFYGLTSFHPSHSFEKLGGK